MLHQTLQFSTKKTNASTMIAETFELIMSRNNTTTLLAAQTTRSGEKDAKPESGLLNALTVNKTVFTTATLILCFCLLSSAGAASIQKRAVVDSSVVENNTNASSPVKMCHQNTPCGWAIYIPFTRRIDYFMKNTCECSAPLACLKTDDDLSVNAYVYRCKTRPAVTTTEIVPEV